MDMDIDIDIDKGIQQIENNTSLYRDLTNSAVINTNSSLYQQRLNQIEAVKEQRVKDESFKEEFDNLKNDVNEIKNLLKSLLESN